MLCTINKTPTANITKTMANYLILDVYTYVMIAGSCPRDSASSKMLEQFRTGCFCLFLDLL